jgi:hypothetical protein
MALLFCGLLGWDLMYEYEKPEPIATPHPVVHSIQHLMAPAYRPSTPKTPIIATATSTATSTATTSIPSIEATSTTEASSSVPTQSTPHATSTSPNRPQRIPRQPKHEIRL